MSDLRGGYLEGTCEDEVAPKPKDWRQVLWLHEWVDGKLGGEVRMYRHEDKKEFQYEVVVFNWCGSRVYDDGFFRTFVEAKEVYDRRVIDSDSFLVDASLMGTWYGLIINQVDYYSVRIIKNGSDYHLNREKTREQAEAKLLEKWLEYVDN